MHTFYHVTPARNVRDILTKGLIPKRGSLSSKGNEPEDAIFLFADLDSVENALMNWLGDEFEDEEQLSLLAVILDLKPAPNHFETVVHNPIPPSAIKLIKNNIVTYLQGFLLSKNLI